MSAVLTLYVYASISSESQLLVMAGMRRNEVVFIFFKEKSTGKKGVNSE